MPDARTHDILTVVTGIALAPLVYGPLLAMSQDPNIAAADTVLLVGAHLLSGIMFSPDLDIDSSIDDRWGIFFWIWRPYMWLVPHRSRWLSHGLVVSALLRLLYFYIVLLLLAFSCAWLLGKIGIMVPDYHIRLTSYLQRVAHEHPREVGTFVLGFITGGAVHTIADWLVTGGKRFLRRIGIRITADYADHDRWYPRTRRRRLRSWSG